MNLYDQGMRFVVRVVESRIEADWMHPADVKPEWLDCTDMDDDQFADAVRKMQLFRESRREQV